MNKHSRESRAILRLAFVDSLPVLMGYSTMGFVAGVQPIAARVPIYAFALMTLAVNFRYCFYGFSLLRRWRGVPFLRKCYLILMLTDENYALESSCVIRDPKRNLRYCTFLSMLNHSYWIVGVMVGAIVVCLLGMAVDPEAIRRSTNGMEFSMAALFIVILTDQIKEKVGRRK